MIVVRDGRQSNQASLNLSSTRRIVVIVGRANDTGSRIAQLSIGAMPVKLFGVVKKHDRFIEADIRRLSIEHGNRSMNDISPARWISSRFDHTQSKRLDDTRARQNAFGSQLRTVLQLDRLSPPFSIWIFETPLRSLNSPPSSR